MSDEADAQRLGQALRAEGRREQSVPDAELERLLRTVRVLDAQARPRSRRWMRLGAAATAVVVLSAVLFVATRPSLVPLTYEVRGAGRIEGERVSAEAGEPVELRFSDGSSVALSPGARVAVERTTADGARVALREGELTVSIVHRRRTRWSVSAGPFTVNITGTRFGMRWDGEQQALSLELYEGSVEVTGGSLKAPLALRTGQRLQLTAAGSTWRITPVGSPAEEPPPRLESEPAPLTPAARPQPPQVHQPSWSKLLSQSDFARVVEQAEAMGIERCLASCSPTNLRILADAARYTGRFALAERSLTALRRRSPEQAAQAAFFLGRLFESKGRNAEALRMYEQHLAEAPRGDYAEQASAGRLRMLLRMGDPNGARAAARAYLQAYPEGVHAAYARRVLDGAAAP